LNDLLLIDWYISPLLPTRLWLVHLSTALRLRSFFTLKTCSQIQIHQS